MFTAVLSRTDSVTHAQLPENVTDVVFNCLLGQVQLAGNLFIGQSDGDQLRQLLLTTTETVCQLPKTSGTYGAWRAT